MAEASREAAGPIRRPPYLLPPPSLLPLAAVCLQEHAGRPLSHHPPVLPLVRAHHGLGVQPDGQLPPINGRGQGTGTARRPREGRVAPIAILSLLGVLEGVQEQQ